MMISLHLEISYFNPWKTSTSLFDKTSDGAGFPETCRLTGTCPTLPERNSLVQNLALIKLWNNYSNIFKIGLFVDFVFVRMPIHMKSVFGTNSLSVVC